MNRNPIPKKQEGQDFIERPTKYREYRKTGRYKEQVLRKKNEKKKIGNGTVRPRGPNLLPQ
jgi:hypothetical protein